MKNDIITMKGRWHDAGTMMPEPKFLISNDLLQFLREGTFEMILPTVDQTEGVWITRTNDQGYHFIHEVFPTDAGIDRAHRSNCRLLIQKGTLQPEHSNRLSLSHSQGVWDEKERYCRKST
jgi:hypothetical protein